MDHSNDYLHGDQPLADVELGERVAYDMTNENLGLHAPWIRPGGEDDRDHQQYRTSIITIRTNKAHA